MHAFFTNVFYAPLYNGLIFFLAVIPGHSVGLAVVLFTLIIKIILFPLSQKSVRTQIEMRRIEPELAAIRLKYKDDKKTQTEKIMEFYRENKINPLAGAFLVIIQLPVLLALYYIFQRGGLPNLDHSVLYAFTQLPQAVSMNFLGADVAAKSTVLALLAGVAQFFQIELTMPKIPKKAPGAASSFGDDLSRSMGLQMRFVMPVVIFFIARSFAAVVALYLITSSVFAVGQELYMRRKLGIIRGRSAVAK